MIKNVIGSIKRVLQNEFWKNVATLASGTAIAQALPILVFPIITRMYSKEAVGFYFVYAAVCLILQIVASMQYQIAIILAKNKTESNNAFELSLLVVLAISILTFFGVYISFNYVAQFVKQIAYVNWLFALPVSTFFLGIFKVANYYLNREKDFKIIATAKVVKTSIFVVLQLLLGLFGHLISGLIISLLISQFVSAMLLLFYVIFKYKYVFYFNITDILSVAKKYKNLPIYNTTLASISALSNQLPLFFLSRYFGVSASGDYGLSNRVVSSPMELMGTSIAQVFTQESSETVNKKGDLHALVKKTYNRLFKISVIPFILLFASSYWLFPFVFGSDYHESGIITMILIPWLFLHFLNSPQSFLFNVMKKQRFMTVYHSLFLLTRIAALYVGYFFYENVFIAVGFYSAIGVVFNLFLTWYYLKVSKGNFENVYS